MLSGLLGPPCQLLAPQKPLRHGERQCSVRESGDVVPIAQGDWSAGRQECQRTCSARSTLSRRCEAVWTTS